MNKKLVIIIVVVLVLAVGAYFFRSQIKSMLGMGAAPTYQPPPAKPTQAMAVPTDNIYKVSTSAAKGQYMTDFQGMTLYTYDKDTSGVSNCSGNCAVAWPVYTSGATAQKIFPENISVITRADGSKQFAWKGMPLYYYKNDAKAGDVTGDGVGGVWHIVKMTPAS